MLERIREDGRLRGQGISAAKPGCRPSRIALGAGIGLIFGAALGTVGTGLVFGAAAGLLIGSRKDDSDLD